MKTAVVTRKPRRLTKADRLNELRAFVGLCFHSFESPLDFKELANKTGLSLWTLYRLAHQDFSLCVRFGTIQALGYAAGLKLVADGKTYRVALVER